jgi:hypothetical protein
MARFWDWRAQAAPVDVGTTATAAEESSLEPVELYTSTALIVGLVAPEGRRLSDILNGNSQLPVRDARSTSLFSDFDGTGGAGWTPVNVDDILLAMPPEFSSPRQMKVHRRQHRVRIRTGPFSVVGTAHVLPGTKIDRYVLQSRMRFLAVTDAQVYSGADPAWERQAAVVLVNVRPVEDLSEMLTIS